MNLETDDENNSNNNNNNNNNDGNGADDAHGMLELDLSLAAKNKFNCVGERSAEKIF